MIAERKVVSVPAAEGRSVARNAVLYLLSRALPLAVAVLAIPYLVRQLGPSRFGVLSLAWVIVGYFSVFDLGLGRAATRHVAHAIGSGQVWRIPDLAWTAVTTQMALGMLASIVLAAVAPILVGHVLNIPLNLQAEARSTFYVLSLAIPLTLVVGSVRGLLEAAQRFDLVSSVSAPLGVANFLLPCLGVSLGWGLPAVTGLLVLSSSLGLAFYGMLCARVYPSLLSVPRFKRAELRRLLSFGSWVMVSSIVGPILVYLDQFALGALLSIAAVGYYNAPYEFITRFLVFPGALVSALFPRFSSLQVGGQHPDFERLISRALKYVLLVVGFLVVLVVSFAHDILQIWLGPVFSAKAALALQILSVGIIFNSAAFIPYSLVQALDRPDISAKLHVLELPLHLTLVWFLVRAYGIPGAALAWALRVTLDSVVLFWAALRLSNLSWKFLLLERIPRTLVVLGAFGFAVAVIALALTTHWLQVAALAVTIVAMAGTGWWYLFDQADRAQIFGALGIRRRTPKG